MAEAKLNAGVSRRRFLKGAAGLALAARFSNWNLSAWSAQSAPDLPTLYGIAEFDPHNGQSALIAHLSDIHIDPRYLLTTTIDHRLVSLLNGLDPLPGDLVVSGDLATSHSLAAGYPRQQENYDAARGELQIGLTELNRFDPRMRRWLIPGNHDTDAIDEQPDLWMEVTGLPPCQRFDRVGVPVFLLNGRHSGDFDDLQRSWMEAEFASVPESQEIVIFVHQPSFMRISFERGVKRDLVRKLAGRSGTVWLFSGHIHAFYEQTYVEQGTLFVQTVVTTANTNAFNDGHNPGFGLIGLSEGRVICRITRDVKETDYKLLAQVNPQTAQSISWPFDDVPYPVMTLEEGDYLREDYEMNGTFWNTGAWLSYVEELTWRLPLGAYAGKVRELLLLGTLRQIAHASCAFSGSGQDGSWQEQSLPVPNKDVWRVPIPAPLRGNDSVWFRMTATADRFAVDLTFGGWGLGSAERDLNTVERWMSQHFKQILNQGPAAANACPAGDGLCNLVKYAYGLDPSKEDKRQFNPAEGPASGGLPRLWRGRENATRRIGLRFPRRCASTVPGIRYVLEESADLKMWMEVPFPKETVFASNDDWEDIALHVPVLDESARYQRVRIELTAALLPFDSQLNVVEWWMYQHFQQTLNQGRAATDACPTGDGVCNLLKYAYGLDPTTVDTRKFNPIEGPASGGLPRLWKGYDGDKRRIGLRFPRRRAITGPGIRYVLEESPDLNEWTEVSSPGEIVFAMEGEWEDVAMHVPLLDEGARFQRVRIELTVELLRLQRDLNAVEGWMYRHFEQTLNLGSAAIDACPAGDGITNLLKYAYGLSPTKVDKREFNPADGPASGGLPRLWQTQADDSRRMGLRFPRRKATTEPGIRYVLEESGDLKAWTEVPTPGETLFATDDEWEDVALHVPVLSKGARFLRVRIELTVALLP